MTTVIIAATLVHLRLLLRAWNVLVNVINFGILLTLHYAASDELT